MGSVQEIIQTEFETRKKKNPHFSLRSFARRLDTSPAQLSQIISGKRPVTLKFIKKVAEKLNYSPRETKSLVDRFITDKGNTDTNLELKRIRLQEDQFKLIADWYHLAILSLTQLKEAKADPRWVSNQLGISISDASQALIRLERLKIISLNPFKQIGQPIEAVSEIPSEAIRKYHKQNLALASEKLEEIPNEFRQFQSISLPINIADMDKYKKIIDQMLDLASDVQNGKSKNHIYNLNVQFFPITKIKEIL